MNRLISTTLKLSILSLCTMHLPAQTTGSRLGANNQNNLILWFNSPREIYDIRKLLQDGQGRQAVKKAHKYTDSLKHLQLGEGLVLRYFALNALCGALTKTGELSEAIVSCSEAIDLIPSRWQALNNRGTAYFVSGEYAKALQDYRRAMSVQTSEGSATEIIHGNIRLAETRLATSQ